jgi:hypothetical protein
MPFLRLIYIPMRNILYLILLPLIANCQLETSRWHFGNRAALNFATGSPIFVNTSTLGIFNQTCGASVSDSAGNLLFYCNGLNVLNSSNAVMNNGSVGVNFNTTYGQSAIAFRKSGKKYYLVLAQKTSPSSSVVLPQYLNYVIVDMSANGGLGNVGTPQSLSPQGTLMSLKMAGTKHCNGKDYWLLAHETNTNVVSASSSTAGGSSNFLAFRITSDSINRTPVISNIGSPMFIESVYISNNQAVGAGYGVIKFSPNGKKICCTFPNRTIGLFDFDNATGQVTNPLQLETIISASLTSVISDRSAFGVEFSPDGNRLYVSYLNGHPAICQYNLAAGSPSAIIASKTVIRSDTLTYLNSNNNVINVPIALQLAIDGKIYVPEYGLSSMGVINNPNALGTLCNYSQSAVALGTVNIQTNPPIWATCGSGLPNFISNVFEKKPEIPPFSGTVTCGQAAFQTPGLNAFTGYSLTSQLWNFGDPVSGTSNTSTAASPLHVFTANGTYTVKLVLNYKCGADTLKKVLVISGLPELTVTAKPKICVRENALFTFSGASTYSVGSTPVSNSTFVAQPTISTTYTVTGTDNSSGCSSSKTFSIMVLPCTSLSENDLDAIGVAIFPNPTSGLFSIENNHEVEIYISDLEGKILLHKQFSSGIHQLNLSEFSNGVYILQTKTEKGSVYSRLIKN